MILRQLTDAIESKAPLKWQEAWDNSGLQIGNGDTDIKAVLLTVDITENTLREAIESGCNLIVSHHPLFFHSVKHLTGSTPQERCAALAIKHDIAVYSLHTPADSYLHGVSGKMAEMCGISEYTILEEPTEDAGYGLGVIGKLPSPIPYREFLNAVKATFSAPYLRYTNSPREQVQTVAFCGGAGSSLTEKAIEKGADVFVSADFKYHDMQAGDGRIGIVDMDHWVSEQAVRYIIQDWLQPLVHTRISRTDHSPIRIL